MCSLTWSQEKTKYQQKTRLTVSMFDILRCAPYLILILHDTYKLFLHLKSCIYLVVRFHNFHKVTSFLIKSTTLVLNLSSSCYVSRSGGIFEHFRDLWQAIFQRKHQLTHGFRRPEMPSTKTEKLKSSVSGEKKHGTSGFRKIMLFFLRKTLVFIKHVGVWGTPW